MPTQTKVADTKKHGKRLTEEQRLAIPGLLVLTGSRRKVAEELGIAESTVSFWAEKTSTEEFDRIREKQRLELVEKSVELIYDCFKRANDLTPEAKFYDVMGAIKILSDRLVVWGAIGAPEKIDTTQNELQNILKEAEEDKRQKAIDEAYEKNDLSKLKAYISPKVNGGETEAS